MRIQFFFGARQILSAWVNNSIGIFAPLCYSLFRCSTTQSVIASRLFSCEIGESLTFLFLLDVSGVTHCRRHNEPRKETTRVNEAMNGPSYEWIYTTAFFFVSLLMTTTPSSLFFCSLFLLFFFIKSPIILEIRVTSFAEEVSRSFPYAFIFHEARHFILIERNVSLKRKIDLSEEYVRCLKNNLFFWDTLYRMLG